jgi:hypothetical protein
MDERNPSNVWGALSKLYLTDSEIVDNISKSNKKEIIKIVKKRFFSNLWETMVKSGETSPPFLLQSDFLSNTCKIMIQETNTVQWGNLEVHDDHFVVNINKNLSNLKKRTILAHEIGHTFLHDTQTRPIKEIYHRERSLDLVSSNVYNEDEGFVYEIGRFLLVPTKTIHQYIPKKPSLNAFLHSCSLFQTTKDVMAKRLFWDVIDFDRDEKFWSSTLLMFYPFDDGQDDLSKIPKGGKYIFRGANYKNFKFEKYWDFILPIIKDAILKPDIVLNSVLIDTKKQKYLLFKKSKIVLELKYLPKDRRIYVMVLKNEL